MGLSLCTISRKSDTFKSLILFIHELIDFCYYLGRNLVLLHILHGCSIKFNPKCISQIPQNNILLVIIIIVSVQLCIYATVCVSALTPVCVRRWGVRGQLTL